MPIVEQCLFINFRDLHQPSVTPRDFSNKTLFDIIKYLSLERHSDKRATPKESHSFVACARVRASLILCRVLSRIRRAGNFDEAVTIVWMVNTADELLGKR